MDWEGFSLRWYEYVAENNEVQRYLWNSVIVGLGTAIISTPGPWPRSACSASRAPSACRSMR